MWEIFYCLSSDAFVFLDHQAAYKKTRNINATPETMLAILNKKILKCKSNAKYQYPQSEYE